MNCKWIIVISITMMALSLAAVSASDLDQITLHDTYLDDDLVVDDLGTDSTFDESLNIDDNMPDSPSEISIDDDVDGSSAETDGDGSADDIDDDAAEDDGSADDDENDDSIDIDDNPSDSDITDGDSIIRNMTNDTPNSNDAPISNILPDFCTLRELQTLIDSLPSGTVLYLYRDYGGGPACQVTVNKDLIIDGQGHTINCYGVCRAFYSTSGNVVLKNINIINGHYDMDSDDDIDSGGAIWIGGTAQYTIENCRFESNWARDRGGAIYNCARKLLTIINCVFKSNNASIIEGGAIYASGELYIENSTFEGNSAKHAGGAISTDYDMDKSILSRIINCVFTSNSIIQNGKGGAINFQGNLLIDRSTFNSNAGGSSTEGGAVYCQGSLIAENSKFTSNYAETAGGAISAHENSSVRNCNFTSNNVDGAIIYDSCGGAIYAYKDLYLSACTFVTNFADDKGGAIFAGENLYINYFQDDDEAYNTLFYDNDADDYSGGAIDCSGTAYIKNTEFDYNTACTDGGAIYLHGDGYITHCSFSGNCCRGAWSNSEGGAIYSEATVHIISSSFVENWAQNYGGAIYAKNVLVNEIGSAYSDFFDNNVVADKGGAIYGVDLVRIYNSYFLYNHALVDAGAVFSKNLMYIYNSQFDSNFAEGANSSTCYGGAVCAYDVFINNTAFNGNHVQDYGGAVYASLASIYNSVFNGNRALEDGGAVYVTDYVRVLNSVFNSNTALVDGGAIFSKNRADIDKSNFDSNSAVGAKYTPCYGGAVRASCTHACDTVFRNNYAENHGGAIFTDTFIDNVKQCTFYDNKAEKDGGAVYINDKNNVSFLECVFLINHAGDEGGAIYLDSWDADLYLLYNIFLGNLASDGHAVFNKGYYRQVYNNWWGGSNPSRNNNMLVEWHLLIPNYNQIDSDPLTMVVKLDKNVAHIGDIVKAYAYFVKSDDSMFTGALLLRNDLQILLPGFKSIESGYNQNSAYMSFIVDSTGVFDIYVYLHGQSAHNVLVVPEFLASANSKDAKLNVNDDNVKYNVKENDNLIDNGNVIASKNILFKCSYIYNKHAIFDYSNKVANIDFFGIRFNGVSIYNQFNDGSIAYNVLFHPTVKSFNVPQSNDDLDIMAAFLFILSILGL